MRRVFIAVAAGIALADASIVTLGLPSILVELNATVEGVALVLGVYTAVLAIALIPAARLGLFTMLTNHRVWALSAYIRVSEFSYTSRKLPEDRTACSRR